MGFEPTTLTLARLHSTTELFPHVVFAYSPETYERFFFYGQQGF